MKRTAIITIILSLSLTFSTSQSINKLLKYGDNGYYKKRRAVKKHLHFGLLLS